MREQDPILSLVKAIPPEEIQLSKVPLPIFISECSFIGHRANEYRDVFRKIQVSDEVIDRIPKLCEMLEEAHIVYKDSATTSSIALLSWKKLYDDAMDLRHNLMVAYELAFDETEILREKLEDITGGNQREDMIEDLSLLVTLGKENTNLLTPINFDLLLLDSAKNLADQLQNLLDDINGDMYESSESKFFRDQIATQLNLDMKKICRAARYVFYHDQSKLEMFNCKYIQDQYASLRTILFID